MQSWGVATPAKVRIPRKAAQRKDANDRRRTTTKEKKVLNFPPCCSVPTHTAQQQLEAAAAAGQRAIAATMTDINRIKKVRRAAPF